MERLDVTALSIGQLSVGCPLTGDDEDAALQAVTKAVVRNWGSGSLPLGYRILRKTCGEVLWSHACIGKYISWRHIGYSSSALVLKNGKPFLFPWEIQLLLYISFFINIYFIHLPLPNFLQEIMYNLHFFIETAIEVQEKSWRE